MRRKIKQGIAWVLSMVLLGSALQPPVITTRAEDGYVPTVASGSALTGGTVSSGGSTSNTSQVMPQGTMNPDSISLEGYIEEYVDLGEVETSAIPMSFFGLSDGQVSLIDGTATNWIDRLDLTGDAQVIKNFYYTLVEASDNDGVNDYLIEDSYFVLSEENGNVSSIQVAEITGTLDGTYSEADAKTKISEVSSEILANYSSYMRAAYDAFDRDHPEVFWLDGSTIGSCSSKYSMTPIEDAYTVSYTITVKFVLKNENFDIRATGYQSETAIKDAITAVNGKISALVNAVLGRSDREKITYFNEQLTKKNEYNTSEDLSAIGHDCRECTSALIGKTGTEGPGCEAYARAFKVLCDKVGIPCVLVDGKAKNSANSEGEAHIWNYVQVDGKWLAVDVTWNDPKGGNSGAVSGVENEKWLFVYANNEIADGMTFIESHPVENQASSTGVGFTNGPELASIREVATEAELNEALADDSVSVIQLTTEVTLSRSEDSKDNAFVIHRPVTITGGSLRLERSGIILGADVTFENINLYFNSPVRNAIIANGYSLTINHVSSTGSTYAIDLFCGGVTDYNGGNVSEIPESGSNGNITIKGINSIGGNIYAGSLSDVGAGVDNIPNTYDGGATIILEKDATGFSNIYAHGARENRSGGYPNEWLPSAELYKVLGDVTIQLNDNAPVTVDGATGGIKNAVFIYKDDENGYVCKSTLSNVDSIVLLPSDSGTMTYFEPNTTQTSFTTLSVPENTRLSFVNMGDEILASSLEGGGELVFSSTSQKLTLDTATGMTKVAVEGVDFSGSSIGIIRPDWNCITVTSATSEGEFSLIQDGINSSMFLEEDGSGNWITKLGEILVQLQNITIKDTLEDNFDEGVRDIYVPIIVDYATEGEDNFLSNVPMMISVNGTETSASNKGYGYEYATGTTSSDIIMWFEYGDNENEEILYITNYTTDDEIDSLPTGKYNISITIPASYMADGQSKTISFVLTVVCNEHTGGTATPTEKAVCEICGTPYGELQQAIFYDITYKEIGEGTALKDSVELIVTDEEGEELEGTIEWLIGDEVISEEEQIIANMLYQIKFTPTNNAYTALMIQVMPFVVHRFEESVKTEDKKVIVSKTCVEETHENLHETLDCVEMQYVLSLEYVNCYYNNEEYPATVDALKEIVYKKWNASTDEWNVLEAGIVPKEVGTYRVSFANWEDAYIEYEIMYLETEAEATAETGWVKEATITAPEGFTISETIAGEYKEAILITENSAYDAGTVITYHLKDENGYITDAKTITVKVSNECQWTYEQGEDKIIVVCIHEACESEDGVITIFAPNNLTYNGEGKSAIVENTSEVAVPSVQYEKKNGAGWEAISGVPVEVGTYKASIIIEDARVSVEYTIAPTPTATVTPTPQPTATVTPKPTATVTPRPTATVTPKPTATVTPKPTATVTPQPTATVTPTPQPTATVTPTPQPTATVTPKPTATVTPKPTQAPMATATPQPTATVTPKPTATVTPKPTQAPTATATPQPTATVTPVPTATPTPKNPDIITEKDVYTKEEQEKLAEFKIPEIVAVMQEKVEAFVQVIVNIIHKVSEEVKEKLEENITLTKTPAAENRLATEINNNPVDLLSKSLSLREQKRVESGEKVDLYMEVKDATKTVSKREKLLVEKTIQDVSAILNEGKTESTERKTELGMYLELNLIKQIGNGKPKKVARPKGKIDVSIQIPEHLLNKDTNVQRVYQILCVDNGKSILLDTEFNIKTNMLSFETNQFTTFALIYTDVPVEK